MRADARANQDRLLDAARLLVVDRGVSVSLDEVARRAGVGSATLYRHFPDRRALFLAVAERAMRASAASARSASDEHPDDALRRYLHAVLDLKVAAVIPLVLDEFGYDEPTLGPSRQEAADAFDRLVDAAHLRGTLLDEVSAGDLGSMLVRLARPLPGVKDLAKSDELAHRHLDLFLRGLGGPRGPGDDDFAPGLGTQELYRASRAPQRHG